MGKCSELSGLCKTDLAKLLSGRGFSLLNWDKEEIENEIDTVVRLHKEM